MKKVEYGTCALNPLALYVHDTGGPCYSPMVRRYVTLVKTIIYTYI